MLRQRPFLLIALVSVCFVLAAPVIAQDDAARVGVEVVLVLEDGLDNPPMREYLGTFVSPEWLPGEGELPRFRVEIQIGIGLRSVCTYSNYDDVNISRADTTAQIIDLATDTVVATTDVPGQNVTCPAQVPYDTATFGLPRTAPIRRWIAAAVGDEMPPSYLQHILHPAEEPLYDLDLGHFSPDGSLVVTVPVGDVWSAETGEWLYRIWWEDTRLYDVAFLPDMTQLVAVGMRDQTELLMIWDIAQEAVVMETEISGAWRLILSAQGRYAATFDFGSFIWVWDLTSGEEIASWLMDDPVTMADFNPVDETQLLVVADDGSVVVRDVVTGDPALTARVRAPLDAVDARFAPDGERVLLTLGDEVFVLDVASGETVLEFDEGSGARVSAAFSPDGRYIVTVRDNNVSDVARIWDSQTGDLVLQLPDYDLPFHHVEWRADGRLLLTSRNDTDVRLWDVSELLAP